MKYKYNYIRSDLQTNRIQVTKINCLHDQQNLIILNLYTEPFELETVRGYPQLYL